MLISGQFLQLRLVGQMLHYYLELRKIDLVNDIGSHWGNPKVLSSLI